MGNRRPGPTHPWRKRAAAVPTVVVMGVSGVGKSTIGMALASRLGWSYVEGDSLHPAANVAKMSHGIALSDEDRWPWLAVLHQVIESHQKAGKPLVLACSALKTTYCNVLVGQLSDVVFVCLTGPRDLIAGRLDRRRGHFMSPTLLESQLATLQPPADAIRIGVDAPVNETVTRIVDQLRHRTAAEP